jgi:KAP family P-loop domain
VTASARRDEPAMSVVGDNPIKNPEDDALGRSAPAAAFADQIASLDTSEGVVVGVLGPWGSGKTSFVNLSRANLSATGAAVLDFNPWMFSGAEQLVESFFVEVAAELKLRPGLASIGNDLQDYGEAFAGLAWLPLVGPWIDRGRVATKALGKLLQRRREGTGERRQRLARALAALERPIVIVLDDIDRLSTGEIRDVFKLVRLTASFPNLVYVLAFDRRRVEEALAEEGIPGRDYLEKILQIAVDLPAVPETVLTRQVLEAIDAALRGVENPGAFDEHAWLDVFVEVIRPLVRNMRDVRRYAAAVHGTIRALDGEIALVDVLALEAIRVFLPDAFQQLADAVETLTRPSDAYGGSGQDDVRHRRAIERLIDAAGQRDEVVRALILRLFPAAQRYVGGGFFGSSWQRNSIRERRVAHEAVLRFYLERVVNDELRTLTGAEEAWGAITDQAAFDRYMRSLDPDRLQDVIAALESYENDFGSAHVVSGTTVLMNLLPELPERPRGMFDPDTRTIVGRVVFRLLRAAGDHSDVAAAVRAILPELNSLYGRWEVITDVGYRENAGHKLVSEGEARDLEHAWRSEVRAATADELAQERDLLRTLFFAKQDAGEDEDDLAVPAEPAVTLALLRSARSDTRSQTAGTRSVRRLPRLVWDMLIDIYDDEATLRERVEALIATQPQGEDELLELAQRYLGGWRPRDFDRA